jgi:hypothetical protein
MNEIKVKKNQLSDVGFIVLLLLASRNYLTELIVPYVIIYSSFLVSSHANSG